MRRFKHGLSHYRLVTHDMGQLIPIAKMEVLPGDSFQQRTTALIRVTPQVAPVMHPVEVRIHHFFTPMRLLMNNPGDWEKFITGGKDGLGEGVTLPTINSPPSVGYPKNSLPDYLGIPPGIPDLEHLEMPIRAFNMIYNEYYRDQDLVPEASLSNLLIPRIAWAKDYFTAARPWPQKGPDVTLPLGTRAPVKGLGTSTLNYTADGTEYHETGGVDRDYASVKHSNPTEPNIFTMEEDPDNPGYPGIYADLSSAEAVNINEFRKAFALQRYQEARARYGSRFVDYLAYLGVRSSDARLQRPEYLGGGRSTISFSEVLNTTGTDSGPAQGEMTGHGISALRSNRYRRFFEEHGYIITMMSVRPKNMYMNALNRSWSRTTKEDFFQKELEMIGQQEILTKELYAQVTDPKKVFGYQDRYSEYKTHPSTIHGEFRDIFDYWHFGRNFGSEPVLNQAFTDCVPTKRVFAEQTQHSLWTMVNNSVQTRRMVNKSGKSRIM